MRTPHNSYQTRHLFVHASVRTRNTPRSRMPTCQPSVPVLVPKFLYSELRQRDFKFRSDGHTLVVWCPHPLVDGVCPGGGHPYHFEGYEQTLRACQLARRLGQFFFRKVKGGSAEQVKAIIDCAGLANEMPQSWPPWPPRGPSPPAALPPLPTKWIYFPGVNCYPGHGAEWQLKGQHSLQTRTCPCAWAWTCTWTCTCCTCDVYVHVHGPRMSCMC